MGIFDVFKRHKDDALGAGPALKDRVTGMMSGHADQANQAFDKAGQVIDDKTGNKYTDQINTGVSKAKDMYGQQTGQPNPPTPPTDTPPQDPGA